jgi:hypothetical protein
MFEPRPTFTALCTALEALADIDRPDGDNEGDPINADNVLYALSPTDREHVLETERIAHELTRAIGGDPNRRILTDLRKRGFPATLEPDQYDPERLRGTIRTPRWDLNISDPPQGDDQD